jgi:hypothetical protein
MMKKTILPVLLWALLPFFLSAQAVLEHTYQAYGTVRVNLEIDGIKYYYADVASRKLLIYNEDHTLWKSLDLGITADTIFSLYVYNLSQTAIFADPQLEYIYSFYGMDNNGAYINGGGIRNESGQTFLDGESPTSRIMNGVPKMTADGKVYALPGLTLEHTYDNSSGTFDTYKVDDAIDAYFNWIGDSIFIYKDDHTLWRKIIYHKTCTLCSATVISISHTAIDPDSNFELVLQIYANQHYTPTIIREDGSIIFQVNSAANRPSFLALYGAELGLPELKLVQQFQSPDSTAILHLPDLAVETTLPYYMLTGSVDQGDYKGFPYEVGQTASSFSTINLSDYSTWKTFAKTDGKNWYPSLFTRHLFDTDDDVEFGCAKDGVSPYFSWFVRDETDGTILLDEPFAQYARLSEIPGKPVKLMVAFINYDGSPSNPASFTKVYGFLGASGLPIIPNTDNFTMIVTPNPGSSDVFLDFNRAPQKEITTNLYDLTGRLIYSDKFAPAEFVKLPQSAFPGGAGVYILEVRSGQSRTVSKVMRL